MKKLITILLMLVNIVAFCQQGGVSITPSGGSPDPSAALDVNFNNKGLLMPRLSAAQRDGIVSPATGLEIYNTDCNVVNYNAGTPGSPNWATINASNVLVAGVSIAAYPVGAICSGTSVTFTATPSNGINSPTYQWQLNSGNVGSNSATYTSTGLNNGDVITCILSTGEACVTGSPATSNSITMTVNPLPSTSGSITGDTSVCASTTGNVYSINPVAGATSYNWTTPPGAAITAGSGSTSITVTFGSSSGNIGVAAVNTCGTSSQVNDAITVTSIPSTPGTISGTNSICANVTGQVYSISGVGGATSYNWTVPSGASITANNDTNITVTFGENPAGNITVSATNSCGTSGQSTLSIAQNNVCSPYVFSYTGGAQTFTVPAGVTSITIECLGAQGANADGGLGGSATGNLAVTPGEQLYVYVGGQSGYNGGGTGNNGNGGGGTDVRHGGTALSNRIIVAGGGGGGYPGGGAGGTGGGTNGGAALYSGPGDYPQGGTQNGGGEWGGTLGTGGNSDASYTGSAGGGGYYGGGSNNTSQGSPVMNSSGGGGSGYTGGVTGGSMQNGVQSGNGQVTITW